MRWKQTLMVYILKIQWKTVVTKYEIRRLLTQFSVQPLLYMVCWQNNVYIKYVRIGIAVGCTIE